MNNFSFLIMNFDYEFGMLVYIRTSNLINKNRHVPKNIQSNESCKPTCPNIAT